MIISNLIEMRKIDRVFIVGERNYFPETSFFHFSAMLHCCGNQYK